MGDLLLESILGSRSTEVIHGTRQSFIEKRLAQYVDEFGPHTDVRRRFAGAEQLGKILWLLDGTPGIAPELWCRERDEIKTSLGLPLEIVHNNARARADNVPTVQDRVLWQFYCPQLNAQAFNAIRRKIPAVSRSLYVKNDGSLLIIGAPRCPEI
jgi:hypothetical protein